MDTGSLHSQNIDRIYMIHRIEGNYSILCSPVNHVNPVYDFPASLGE